MTTTAKKATAPAAAVELDEDDVWVEIETDNYVPPMKVKGITLHQPTARQVTTWRLATTIEAGEKALFGDQYDAIHKVFDDEPVYKYENFNVRYLKHMFGTAGDDELKG